MRGRLGWSGSTEESDFRLLPGAGLVGREQGGDSGRLWESGVGMSERIYRSEIGRCE